MNATSLSNDPAGPPPAWLSLLYAPADDLARVNAAARSGAHAVVLDLEDFVGEENKEAARGNLEQAVAEVRKSGVDAVVRINRRMDAAVADLDRAVIAPVDAIMVPKVMGADHLRLLDEVVHALEARRGLTTGRIRFIALVETASALARISEICTAVPRVAAIGLGGEDIARECGMVASARTLQHIKQDMIFRAVAAGIVPLGFMSSVAGYRDAAGFADMVAASRDFGFQAATCLRPEQVGVVNRVYAPTDTEIERARRLIASDSAPDRASRSAVPDEYAAGLRRARLLLARAALAAGRP